MSRISSGSIRQIYNAGVDFIKTIQGKGVREGFLQVGSRFLNLYRIVSTSMSNSFSSISRKVKQSLESFFPKLSIVSNGQKQIGSGNDLVDNTINKLKEMGVKKDILKFLQTGVDKSGHKWFDVKKPIEQEHYIRNDLVNKSKENGTITNEAYHILKNQSLEHVLSLINGETLIMEKDGKEVSIRLDKKDLKLKDNNEEVVLKKNGSSPGENFANNVARMDWFRQDVKIQGQIPKSESYSNVNSVESKTNMKTNDVGIAYSNDMINLNTELYFANLPDEEIDAINQRIQDYEKSNPDDKCVNNKVQELVQFVKNRKGNKFYRENTKGNQVTDLRNDPENTLEKLKERRQDTTNNRQSKHSIEKEISNRTEIQKKVNELFPEKTEKSQIDTQRTIDKTFSDKTEAYNKILKEIQTLPKDILSDATTAFYKKSNNSNPTLEQFQRFYNNLSSFKNTVTTMEAFNDMLKSFD